MRTIKLALRIAAAWRRSIAWSTASLAVAAALAALTGAVVTPLYSAVRDNVCRAVGEYVATVPGSEVAAYASRAEASGLVLSARAEYVGTVEGDTSFALMRVAIADLDQERMYDDAFGETSRTTPAVGQGILVGTDDDRTVVRVTLPDSERIVRIADVVPNNRARPTLLIHDPDSLAAAPSVSVRIAGKRGPIDRQSDAAGSLEASGMAPTLWYDVARAASAPLGSGTSIALTVLALLAVASLVPGGVLLARRAEPSIRLLRSWGMPARTVSIVYTLVGTFAAAIAAAIGSVAGMAVAGVLNAQHRAAVELVPVELAYRIQTAVDRGTTAISVTGADGTLMTGPVTPVLGWSIAIIAIATLLGAVTALPSARIAGRVGPRRDLWHW